MHKSSSVKRYSIVLSLIVTSLLGVALFQNCAQTQFTKDYSSSSLSSSVDGLDADGIFYTNAKIVPVNVNIESQFMSQMRAGANADLSKAPWGKISNKIMVDLGSEYASDGSKDGLKTIYIEARDQATDRRFMTEVKVFLDTQAPQFDGQGILTTGIQGKDIKQNDNVDIAWQLQDKVAKSGKSSGVDVLYGFRWGFSDSNDCSESKLTFKSGWMRSQQNMSLQWPQADPLKAFYICLYAKDRAGNIANYLSQPMTSLWTVIAGDNSQGNGSSATSNKVRFKSPASMFQDPDKNISVYDEQFGSWRTIRSAQVDASRTIETSTLPVKPTRYMVYDSQKNAYTAVGGIFYKISADKTIAPIKIFEGLSTANFAIRNYKNTERLIILNSNGVTPYTPNTASYLFEIPLTEIVKLNGTKTLKLADLIASYKIAGNGIVPYTKEGVADDVILSAKDSADGKYSLGQGVGIATTSSGDILFATHADGNGSGYGNHSIRRLTQLADGTFKQKIISRQTWVLQLAYVNQTNAAGVNTELLVAGGVGGGLIIDLKTGVETKPFKEINSFYVGGALVAKNELNDLEFYFATRTTSQIFHFGSDFKLIEVLGRPVFDSIPDALSSIIGNPDSMVQDPDNGDIYYLDTQNALINKVTLAGVVSTIAGKPQVLATKTDYDNESLSQFLLGTGSWTIGYRYQLAADFDKAKNRKILYVTATGGRVHAIDLVNSKVNTILKALKSGSRPEDARFLWGTTDVAISKTSAGNSLIVSRYFNVMSNASWHKALVGFVSEHPVNGDVAMGEPKDYMGNVNLNTVANNATLVENSKVEIGPAINASVVIDSTGYTFVSGPQLKISDRKGLQTRVLAYSIAAFTVVEEGKLRHVIYQSGSRMAVLTLDTTDIFNAGKNPAIAAPKAICMPGTALNGAGAITTDKAGNLLIADTFNARLLKYRIRNASGALVFNYCQ